MIKKNRKTLIVTSIVILIPIIIGLLLWDKLPEKIPFHWNINGEVDSWASKPVAVFALSPFMLAMQWLCVLATSTDPKKANHTPKQLTLILWLVPVLNAVLTAVMYTSALGATVRIEAIMYVFLGLMFVIIGNYMPKCKQSYTIGIRISWTLNSEENWNKTHRFGGKVWVAGGVFTMASALLGSIWLLIGVLVVMVATPTLYSYLYYRKHERDGGHEDEA